MRDVILTRQKESKKSELVVEETKMRALMSAIHAAAGNKRGARQAMKFRLTAKEPQMPRMEDVLRRMPVGDEGLVSAEALAERKRELGLV